MERYGNDNKLFLNKVLKHMEMMTSCFPTRHGYVWKLRQVVSQRGMDTYGNYNKLFLNEAWICMEITTSCLSTRYGNLWQRLNVLTPADCFYFKCRWKLRYFEKYFREKNLSLIIQTWHATTLPRQCDHTIVGYYIVSTVCSYSGESIKTPIDLNIFRNFSE